MEKSMDLQHKLWSNEEFSGQMGKLQSSAQAVLAIVQDAVLDVVMHYHQHSYDTSRPKRLYQVLEENHLGKHINMFVAVLRASTGITGINEGEWKHSQKRLDDLSEAWEVVLKRVEQNGIESFGKPAGGKQGQGNKKPRVILPQDTPESVVTALKALTTGIEGVSEDVALDRIRRASGEAKDGSALDQIKDATLRSKVEEQILLYVETEEISLEAAIVAVDRGINAVMRNLKNSLKAVRSAAEESQAA